jgi:exopolysaccharide production protein ExoZ
MPWSPVPVESESSNGYSIAKNNNAGIIANVTCQVRAFFSLPTERLLHCDRISSWRRIERRLEGVNAPRRFMYRKTVRPMSKHNNITSIQLLRWSAATFVAVAHALQKTDEINGIAPRHSAVIEWGIGVDIFFVISGFIMLYTFRLEFGQPGMAWQFLKRRILRIIPLYWLITTGTLLAIMLSPRRFNHAAIDHVNVVMSYLMLAWPNPNGGVFPVFALGWTLNFEMYFYAIFALALFFNRHVGITVLILYLIATVVLANLWINTGWALQFYGQSTVLEFAVGQILGIAYIKGFRISLTLGIFVGVCSVLLHIALRHTGEPPRFVVLGIPAAMFFFAFVFSVIPAMHEHVLRALSHLGDASYAMYLTHPYSISACIGVLTHYGVDNVPLLVAAAAIVSTMVAVVVFRFIERPIGIWLRGTFVSRVGSEMHE